LFSRLSTIIATGPPPVDDEDEDVPASKLNHPDGRTDNSPLDNIWRACVLLLMLLLLPLMRFLPVALPLLLFDPIRQGLFSCNQPRSEK
jgi:hypothetical protein